MPAAATASCMLTLGGGSTPETPGGLPIPAPPAVLTCAGERARSLAFFDLGMLMLTLMVWPSFRARLSSSRGSSLSLAMAASSWSPLK